MRIICTNRELLPFVEEARIEEAYFESDEVELEELEEAA